MVRQHPLVMGSPGRAFFLCCAEFCANFTQCIHQEAAYITLLCQSIINEG